MPYEHTHTRQISLGGETINTVEIVSAEGRDGFDVIVPDSSTDFEVVRTIDISSLKSFYLMSDQDVTIQTNDGTTPDDQFVLTAGVAYQWTEDSVADLVLTQDVTSFFITNTSGAAASVRMECLLDVTP